MKVLMLPLLSQIRDQHGGINRVVEGWHKTAARHDIKYVEEGEYDLFVSHAGTGHAHTDIWPDICACHGLYWANDYPIHRTHLKINASVIDEARHARAVTVPSRWVAKSFQRDMHFTPHIIPHGIDWRSWQHDRECSYYVLWNKNRPGDACNPRAVTELAVRFQNTHFVTTFADEDAVPFIDATIHVTGAMPHSKMKPVIQQAGIYLSTARETFGIGTLEAMASGVPVLGWDFGGNRELVTHGFDGYLAEPWDYEDLAAGLAWCMKYRDRLGGNARQSARDWSWEAVGEKIAQVYEEALHEEIPTVGVVIPCYNYAHKVGRAIESAIHQDYPLLTQIVVVDDGSADEAAVREAVGKYDSDDRVILIRQPNSGVAIARNRGIAELRTKYVCCLDADDAIEAGFLSALVPALEADRSIGIAYSRLRIVIPDGRSKVGSWPWDSRYDDQVLGKNQVPTCCLFRRKVWERLGGYRQRYAPTGAGAEDAELWLRIGSIGYSAKLASDDPLFIYSLGEGHTSGAILDYKEPDWLGWHPWVYDGHHPFASVATPKQFSHPARQYDSPLISVIIPVGPGHQRTLIEALDSLEAQTFREWEVIVVDDSGEDWGDLLAPYPYVTLITTEGERGAGYARNRGAEVARAKFLLFLDADDFLKPDCLNDMLLAWDETSAIVYSDYEAHAEGVDPKHAKKQQDRGVLLYYEPNSGYAVWNGKASTYDWERCHIQPENPPYLWCLISSLVPKVWHEEVGGFDEIVPSWEDWDYWVRLGMLGKPFVRIPKPLVVYLYYTGSRRETGYELGGQLLHYYTEKYKEIEKMPCTGCGQKRVYNPLSSPSATASQAKPASTKDDIVSDSDFIRCRYNSPNKGWHHVVGAAVFEAPPAVSGLPRGIKTIGVRGGHSIDYGYRSGGDVFLVHKEDIQLIRYFEPIERIITSAPSQVQAPTPTREEPPAPPEPPSGRGDIERLLRDIQDEDRPESGEPESDDTSLSIDPEEVKDPELKARLARGEKLLIDKETKISYSNTIGQLPIPPNVLVQLKRDGITEIEQVADWTEEDWKRYRGIGGTRAAAIMAMARQ